MTAYWMRIVKRQYDAGNKTAEEIQMMVPRFLTQGECDEIIGVS